MPPNKAVGVRRGKGRPENMRRKAGTVYEGGYRIPRVKSVDLGLSKAGAQVRMAQEETGQPAEGQEKVPKGFGPQGARGPHLPAAVWSGGGSDSSGTDQ